MNLNHEYVIKNINTVSKDFKKTWKKHRNRFEKKNNNNNNNFLLIFLFSILYFW